MKVTSERKENCQVRVTVELDAAEAEDKLRQTAQRLSRRYTVPGYRKGKAPYAAVLRTFGRELLQEQALEEFGQELYDQALKQVEYEPYAPGELEKVEWDPFRLEILLPIMPEVDLGDYRSVRATPEPKPVADDAVDRYLEELRQQHTQWVPVERPAALGDHVVVDIEGRAGDQVVLSNQGRELTLDAASPYPLPGFHEQVAGMSPGEDKQFTLTYPDDDPRKDMAGREATLTVKLLTINEPDVPALDDELAQTVGDYSTLADLRAAAHKNLEEEARLAAEAELPDKALDAMIAAATKIEYPPQAVEKELDSMLEDMEQNLSTRGIKLDTFLGMIKKTRDAYRQELRPAAEERLRHVLALGEAIKREGLKVEEAEVEAKAQQLKAQEEFQSEEMQKLLDGPAARAGLANDLLLTKIRDRIAEIARGEAPPLEAAAEAPGDGEALAEAERLGEAEVLADAKVLAEGEALVDDEALAAAEALAESQAEAEAPGNTLQTPEP
jgi:trigger factor